MSCLNNCLVTWPYSMLHTYHLCTSRIGYMAIRTLDPSTRDQLVHGICTPCDQGGSTPLGWLDYDRAFHQQAAADPSLRWNTLQPGLQASTILGQRNRQEASFCTLCHGVDHVRAQCALMYLHPSARRSPPGSYNAGIKCKSGISASCRTKAPVCTKVTHVCVTCYLRQKAQDCVWTQDNAV